MDYELSAMNQEPNKSISKETMSAICIVAFVSLFILANLTVGFVWPLYILATAIGFLVSAKYPRSGLFAIVFLTVVFERFFTLQTFFIGKVEYKIYPLDIVIAGIMLGIFYELFFHRQAVAKELELAKNGFSLQKKDRALIGFIILNAIYFIFSAFVFSRDPALAFSTLKNYGFYGLLYFMTAFLIRGEKDLKRLFKFFFAGAIAVIAFIVIGIARGEGLWSEFTPLSTSGIRILAFPHGLYLALEIFPILSWLIFKDSTSSKRGGQKRSNFLIFLLFVWLVGILGTMMRHLWISIAVALVALYFLLPQEKKTNFRKVIFRFVVPLAVAGIFLFYALSLAPHSQFGDSAGKIFGVLSERAATLGSANEDESFSWRSLVWKSALEKYKQSPLLGIGTGGRIYVETKDYKDFIEIRNIHNSYLSILIQFGLPGIAMFLFFIYQNIKKLIGFRGGNERYDRYKFSILGIISVYAVALFFQPYLETNILSVFFWITLGLIRILPEVKMGTHENSGNQQI